MVVNQSQPASKRAEHQAVSPKKAESLSRHKRRSIAALRRSSYSWRSRRNRRTMRCRSVHLRTPSPGAAAVVFTPASISQKSPTLSPRLSKNSRDSLLDSCQPLRIFWTKMRLKTKTTAIWLRRQRIGT